MNNEKKKKQTISILKTSTSPIFFAFLKWSLKLNSTLLSVLTFRYIKFITFFVSVKSHMLIVMCLIIEHGEQLLRPHMLAWDKKKSRNE